MRVKFKGLLFQKAHIKNGVGSSSSDILGWDYVYRTVDGICYKYYSAEPPLIGTMQAVPIIYPHGLRVFDSYKIDYKKAIDIFNSKFHEMFVATILAWPLTPECKEPYWYIKTTTGYDVIIGADSGKIYSYDLQGTFKEE